MGIKIIVYQSEERNKVWKKGASFHDLRTMVKTMVKTMDWACMAVSGTASVTY